MTKIGLRAEQLMCLFLMLTSVLLAFSFLPRARAVMQVFSISPATGNVGTNVTLTANLTTTNGPYNVTFDGVVQAVGNAGNNTVVASFLVPEAASDVVHNVTVIDLSTLESATDNFTVSTAYYLNVTVPPSPAQLQEGDSVPILLNVTGGNSTVTYGAQVDVRNPDNSTYSEQLGLKTSALGSGIVTLSYPGNFTTGANTNYVGNYVVSSNLTATPQTVIVGLTNSTKYHRMQTVNIKAVYKSNETVRLNVTGNSIQYSVELTADSAGLIDYSNFTVPLNASVGIYAVNVVSVASLTVKTIPDTQVFTVPGFAFNLTARNLAGDVVPNVAVRAFENGTSVSNQTTGSNGLAVLMLEIGNYTVKGYSQSVEVGEGYFEINNTEASDLVFNLTDLSVRVVAVVNGAEVGIPEAGVYLTPENVALTTDVTGNVVEESLLPNGTYTLNASRYNIPFNVTTIIESSSSNNIVNGEITSLLVNGSLVPVFNVTIGCPSYTLQVSAFKADGQPFSNATVEAKELVGGINYDGNTDSNGIVAFHNAILGEYNVEILDSAGKELNSTTVDLFEDQNVTVNCNLFGLNITVSVTDYFGQPFANTIVTLQGNGVEQISSRTQANGNVTFVNLVGDRFSISVYLSDNGQPSMVESLLVDGSTTVSINMNRYVLLAGLPVETSQLAIVIIIVLSVLLILSLEVYRRRRNKSQKTDG